MRPDRDAEAVRAALSRLRADDARNAPAFRDVMRPRARSRPGWRLAPARLALAATVMVAALGYGMWASRAPRLTLPREVAALSSWRPVTAALLDTPGRGLLRSASPFGESVISVPLQGEPR